MNKTLDVCSLHAVKKNLFRMLVVSILAIYNEINQSINLCLFVVDCRLNTKQQKKSKIKIIQILSNNTIIEQYYNRVAAKDNQRLPSQPQPKFYI